MGTKTVLQARNREASRRWSKAERESRESRPGTGRSVEASSIAHWGEVVQGPIVLPNGDIVIGLVTQPDPTFRATVVAKVQHGSGIFCGHAGKWKAFDTACIAQRAAQVRIGLSLLIRSNIPEGVGAGSSTADCTAVALAVLKALGEGAAAMSDLDILREIVFKAEKACDPLPLLKWGVPVLWGSRCGELIKVYESRMPETHALGFVTQPGVIVSTDDLARKQAQVKPLQADVDSFAAILQQLDYAIRTGSARGVAEAATASGTLNQRHCRILHWDRLLALAGKVGALGVSCSHSGTAAALLFEPDAELSTRILEASAVLREMGAAYIHEFRPYGR